jgi:hypothetical protein
MIMAHEPSFLVMYLKLSNIRRKGGIEFKGPFVGGTRKTKKDADKLVKKIIAEQRGFAIMPKVFPVLTTFKEAHDGAKAEFKKLKEDIKDADCALRRKLN